jgi:hypothetical protein
MYVCMYACMCVCVCVCVCKHVKHAYTYIHVCTYIHTHKQSERWLRPYGVFCWLRDVYMYTCIHTYIHTYIHTNSLSAGYAHTVSSAGSEISLEPPITRSGGLSALAECLKRSSCRYIVLVCVCVCVCTYVNITVDCVRV